MHHACKPTQSSYSSFSGHGWGGGREGGRRAHGGSEKTRCRSDGSASWSTKRTSRSPTSLTTGLALPRDTSASRTSIRTVSTCSKPLRGLARTKLQTWRNSTIFWMWKPKHSNKACRHNRQWTCTGSNRVCACAPGALQGQEPT